MSTQQTMTEILPRIERAIQRVVQAVTAHAAGTNTRSRCWREAGR